MNQSNEDAHSFFSRGQDWEQYQSELLSIYLYQVY